ncbi:TIGR00297 family protein [Methanosaeta sp. UBA458]|uniref:TIGR00297 family protein n=1 Tax=Methanosaeta sp. UBA458 TaxID=1915561 RepID=UPI00257A2176|nr:TIGR00297 family protein [Methanosaeta sp. UBA458]
MNRENASRLAIGLMALLLPYAWPFTVIALAAAFFVEKSTRLLAATLGFLLIIRPVLAQMSIDLPLYVIAISFMASTFASLGYLRFSSLTGSIAHLLITVALGYPLAIWISAGTIPKESAMFLAVLGGLSGTFLNQASRMRDFAVPFGTAMVMWLFSFRYPFPELHTIILICLFALILGVGAYWAKAADISAVISETIVGFLVIIFAGLSWFLLLLIFYLMGGGFTRYGYAKKEKLGIAQSHGGARGYKNVFSNSLVPLAMAVFYGIYGNDLFVYAFIGSVATANGDTLASEIGETSSSKPRMITTLKETEPGVDGGVTLLGEGASLLGALIISILAAISGMTGLLGIVIGTAAGFLGTNFDSLLGATLQSRGTLSNNGVNLAATAFGAIAGGVVWYVLHIWNIL